MKTILVTGGTGFIGSNLCTKLCEKETNYVICLDNNYTGRMSNISNLLSDSTPNIEFIKHDITESLLELFDSLEEIERIDEIYHLACPASPPAYQREPIKTIQTGVIGTMNVLDLAVKHNSKILFTSTSEIYGDPEISPQVEEYWGNVNTIGIRSCYDESKRMAETLMIEYERKYKLEIRIVRIFNTYGPKMDPKDGRVVSNFINQCLENKPITIYGDGSQTRSFCYVDDMVRGLTMMMANRKTTGPVNFGNPNELTIKDIAEKYIIPGETADGAVMFIPAEAVFAEIHARFPDLVETAQQARVWLTSPTTMMAVLTTSRAVLKDAATRKQVHIIQDHLVALSKDFERFQSRMGNLAKHIDQANRDVEEVHTSARKISSRFEKIEKVELHQEPELLDGLED